MDTDEEGSASGHWTNAANWTASSAPANGDALVFPNGITRRLTTNSPGGATNLASLSINGDGYALRSPSLIVTNGLTDAGPVNSANTILASITSVRGSTWSVGGRSTLVLGSNANVEHRPGALAGFRARGQPGVRYHHEHGRGPR